METSLLRTKESVTPSGVPFTVRSLKGKDQSIITNLSTGKTNHNKFNTMLSGALLKVGDVEGHHLNVEFVSKMLSNDRKFMLVTLRQHTLGYQELFNFNYEWPLQKGAKDKEVHEYSVRFNHENFPVTPYRWMAEYLADKKKKDNDDTVYDGHVNQFPILFESYDALIEKHCEIEGTFSGTEVRFKYNLLTGEIEARHSGKSDDQFDVNTALEIRHPQYWGEANNQSKGTWFDFDVKETDLIWVEYLRKHLRVEEGRVNTTITIEHQTNKSREATVDLVSTPAFFFPSQAI